MTAPRRSTPRNRTGRPAAIQFPQTVMTKERFAREALQRPTLPQRLTRAEYDALTPRRRAAYDTTRRQWHAVFDYVEFRRDERRLQALRALVEDNRYATPPLRGLWIDGSSTTGKTSMVRHIAHEIFRARTQDGAVTVAASGSELIPVAWIDVAPFATFRSLTSDILRYYNGEPSGPRRSSDSAASMALAAADCVVATGTELVVFDDVHHLANRDAQRDSLGDFLKYLASQVPATFVMIGTGVKSSGILTEGRSPYAEKPPTMRRGARMVLRPYPYTTDEDKQAWRSVCESFEKRIVLLRPSFGCLTDNAEEIWRWTDGHIGALHYLASASAAFAMNSNDELLTRDVLRTRLRSMAADFDDDSDTFA